MLITIIHTPRTIRFNEYVFFTTNADGTQGHWVSYPLSDIKLAITDLASYIETEGSPLNTPEKYIKYRYSHNSKILLTFDSDQINTYDDLRNHHPELLL